MTFPKVSIIIPCYNSGEYLPEAIQSVEEYPDKDVYEIIITNDGSTDESTVRLLDNLATKGYKILHQKNSGPASARNTAIMASSGEYLLFLDSDNKIKRDFIDKGIKLLDENEDVGVVYGNADFFGEVTDLHFKCGDFDMKKLLAFNYIDMCSIIRKKVWDEVGPLDEDPSVIGYEDWEYWIRIGNSKWKFFYINQCVFDYRMRSDSLIKQAREIERFNKTQLYIYSKYLELFIEHYKYLNHENSVYNDDKRLPFRSFFKYMYYKYLKSN
ncbi:MAG: glycosyl transferase [Mucilaginibacter sp.]|nr:glycosyl transferase [Mucilaginibacter sp.]